MGLMGRVTDRLLLFTFFRRWLHFQQDRRAREPARIMDAAFRELSAGEEVVQHLHRVRPDRDREEVGWLAKAFERFDTDSNGVLDAGEVRGCLVSLGLADDEDCAAAFQSLAHGANGFVVLDDWLDRLPPAAKAAIIHAQLEHDDAARGD